MFQIIDQITDEYGNGKANWQLEVYDLDTGLAVPMYADYDGTIPIEDVSFIADRVVTDQFGLVQGGFVQPGTYGKRYYDDHGVLRRTIESIDMYGASEATDAAISAAAALVSEEEASASAAAAAGSATNAAASASASDASADASAASAATAEAARDQALIYGNATIYATWTDLAAASGMAAGDTAMVVSTDMGTHTDPVVGGTVDNAGVFQYSASPAGWERIADLESQLAGDSAALAEAWAEGTEPGGPGTKSALEWAGDAADSAASISSAIGISPVSSSLVPVIVDASDNVAIWLEGGKLATAGVASSFFSNLGLGAVSSTYNLRVGCAPLVQDASGNAAVWLTDGKLDAAGIGGSLLTAIQTGLNIDLTNYVTLSGAPSRGQRTVSTDGRTLRQYRRKRAQYRVNGTTIYRVALIGDSWTERSPIPQALASLLYADGAQSGLGFVTTGPTPINSVSATWTGWTTYDVDVAGAAPTRGCGPDGYARYATGTSATAALTGLTGTQITIYYWNGNGTFRYRIDGGSWTAVAGTSANAQAKVTISGLSNTSHTLDIDLTGNAGTAEIHGLRVERPAVGGVEFFQIGNGSARGTDYTNIKTQFAYFANEFQIDAAFINLTINDYRLSSGTAQLLTGIADIVSGLLTASAGCGIGLIAPPACGASGTPAQTSYRDAMLSTAQASGYEFLNLYDEWDTYALESAASQWVDTLHIAAASVDTGPARRFAQSLFDNLLR